MYTLYFTTWENEEVVKIFDDSSDAVNEAVKMQVNEGGYNTTGDWFYKITNSNGMVVYEDECMRHFEYFDVD
ncbi:hypothetical protein HKCCA1065_06865 [Rhodobacterales bacterium HKCCA1065]|nr:hypothetical protein [Rhodobacterales bacterium HKCCA1065]